MIRILSNVQRQIRTRSLAELAPFAILALIAALLLGFAKIASVISSGSTYSFEGGYWWQVSTSKTYDVDSSTSAITSISKQCLHGAPNGFASQSGGEVKVDSREGKGTTVTLVFPRSEKPLSAVAPQEGVADTTRVSPANQSGNVLLVEADDAVAALASEMLKTIGFDVVRVASGAAALGALANGRNIDIVFSDVMMAGLHERT